MGGGMDMGGGVDDLGGPDGGDVGGEEESMDMGAAPEADAGEPVSESRKLKKNLLKEIVINNKPKKSYFDEYLNGIKKTSRNEETDLGRVDIVDSNFMINEELDAMAKKLDKFIEEQGISDVLSD